MVDISNFGSIDSSKALNYSNFKALNNENLSEEDISIFNSATSTNDESVDLLNAQLDAVEAEQGFFSNAWNDVKEFVGVGTSVEKCDEAIEKFKKGEITYDEAAAEIEEFSNKQDSSLNLFANIATSFAAIGAVAIATVATGGAALPVVAAIGIGAGAGAAAKAGFKLTDRATNDVEGDALDAKQIAKDTLSGAVTGGLAAATMGTAAGKASVGEAAVGCAKTGLKTGAISGSANYAIDCAFNEGKDFNAGEFVASTATGAVVGGVVGGIMGGVNGSLHANNILNSGCNLETMVASTQNASIENVAANSACSASYKILNDRIRAIAA